MSAFISAANGKIQSINGNAGNTINNLSAASQNTPGRDIVINTINQIIAATNVVVPVNNCDPQSQLLRTQQRIQRQVQQKLQEKITEIINNNVSQDANVQNLLQQLRSIQVSQLASQNQQLSQQQEIVNQELQNQIQQIIVGAIGKASQQMPNAVKVANSTAAGLRPVAAVAESLSTFVPSQGINMGNYGSKIKTVQTVSQACFV